MRKRALAALGGAAIMAIAGCGQQPVGGTAEPVTADAQALVRAVEGVEDGAQTANFSMTMNAGPVSATAAGQGRFTTSDFAMSAKMTMDMGDLATEARVPDEMTIEMRLLDGVVYLKVPENMPDVPSGKPWLRASADDLSAGQQAEFKELLEQSDPTKALDQLIESGTIVRTEPGQDVDGETATKYTVEVDYDKLADAPGAFASPGALPAGIELGTIPVDVWINDADLPLKVRMDLGDRLKQAFEAELEAQGKDVSGELRRMLDSLGNVTFTSKYFDWGTDVTIEAPPAGQVGELPLGG